MAGVAVAEIGKQCSGELMNRGAFLIRMVGAPGIVVAGCIAIPSVPRRLLDHPMPRSGITAAKVATAEQLKDDPELIPLFDRVREIPQIMDGIRCRCGCADHDGFYSLLTCFESPYPMAVQCPTCRHEGELVAAFYRDGKTLNEIRASIDARFRSSAP